MGRFHILMLATLALTLPGLAAGVGLWTAGPVVMVIASGLAVLAAASAMLLVLHPGLAMRRGVLVIVAACAAIAPELSIDAYHVWGRGWGGSTIEGAVETTPMLAAMTGSSGLLVGLGWPLLILVFWLRNRRKPLQLSSDQAVELSSIFLVVLYSFTIFIRGYLWAFDAPILLMLFIVYVWRGTRSRGKVGWLEGTPDTGHTFPLFRKLFVVSLLFVPVGATLMVAGPFSDSVRQLSPTSGWGHFELLQVSLPLASKLPLIIGVMMLTWQHRTPLATLSLLISQLGLWTLLVAALPLMLALQGLLMGGSDILAFDERQKAELVLAASQSLYALALMAGLSVSWKTALALLLPFEANWLLSAFYPDRASLLVQGLFSVMYLTAALAVLLAHRQRLQVLAGIAPSAEDRHPVEARPPQDEALSRQ